MRLRFSVLGTAAGAWLWSALVAAPLLRADELTGRWSGEVEGRGNYYYERSTRVMIPTGRIAIASPNGMRTHLDYLVDVITSASIPSGASEDKLFTELRHGIGTGVGKRFDAGENDLDLSVYGIYSTEPDYKSWMYGAAGAYSFSDKTMSLSLALTGVNDKIYQKKTFRGDLDGITASLGLQPDSLAHTDLRARLSTGAPRWLLGEPLPQCADHRRAVAGEAPSAASAPQLGESALVVLVLHAHDAAALCALLH